MGLQCDIRRRGGLLFTPIYIQPFFKVLAKGGASRTRTAPPVLGPESETQLIGIPQVTGATKHLNHGQVDLLNPCRYLLLADLRMSLTIKTTQELQLI